MIYAVEILRTAQKQLGKIDRQTQSRIIESIRGLATDPRPPGCKKLSGRPAWRIRIGSYRVIYEIHDAKLVVLVVSVGDRKDVLSIGAHPIPARWITKKPLPFWLTKNAPKKGETRTTDNLTTAFSCARSQNPFSILQKEDYRAVQSVSHVIR